MSTTLKITSLGSKVGWDYESVQPWGNSVNASSFSFTGPAGGLASGTGANQADLIYIVSGTLAAGATQSFQMTGSSLTDIYGNPVNFARVKLIYLALLTSTTASAVHLAPHATRSWAGAGTPFDDATARLGPVKNAGNLFLFDPGATGYPVTATTADTVDLVNEDGSNVATYQLVLVGCSA